MEVVIHTESAATLAMNSTDAEDWFVVSGVFEDKPEEEVLGTFKVNEETFVISKATAYKCPRCWKYQATSEDCTCKRCAEVVDA